MFCKRQFGVSFIEPLIILILISITLSCLLHWQHQSFKRIQQQNIQVQQSNSGFSLISVMIGLLLMSVSLVVLMHLYMQVLQTKNAVTDLLQQNRVASLFNFTLRPFVNKIGYIGCHSNLNALESKLQKNSVRLYKPSTAVVPEFIRNNTQSIVLFVKQSNKKIDYLFPSSASQDLVLNGGLALNKDDVLIINNCMQAESAVVFEIKNGHIHLTKALELSLLPWTEVHRIENCWLYIGKTTFSYPKGLPIHALFSACDHQSVQTLLRGIDDWNITIIPHALHFSFHTESANGETGEEWYAELPMLNNDD